ncbi:MAG: hypothetical protein MUF87_20465 [Anaerolineae bacterium]|nr:hypothetical protein [Anaerolineae bacterium]
MNTIVQEDFEILKGTLELRASIFDLLSDADLEYRLPGDNASIRTLCIQHGEVMRSYIDSFKHFKQDWHYRHAHTDLNLTDLRAWINNLDEELFTTLSGMSDTDIQTRIIDRGFPLPPRIQVQVLIQAALIFCGMITPYLRALQKPLPEKWVQWIG